MDEITGKHTNSRGRAETIVHAKVPLSLLLPSLRDYQIRAISKLLDPSFSSLSLHEIKSNLLLHPNSPSLIHSFRISSSSDSQIPLRQLGPSPLLASSQMINENPSLLGSSNTFPPNPVPSDQKLHILNRAIDAISEHSLREIICSICARLSPKSSASTYSLSDPCLSILCRDNSHITRIERHHATEPIRQVVGPILHSSAHQSGIVLACIECNHSLLQSRIPKSSLANGNWIGDIPSCLLDLNFIEKLLVAKHRHNVCVVRVSEGHGRLRCNAVVQARPIQRVVSHLPPTPDELAEVLAIIFTGSKSPDASLFERTPLLIRRSRVRRALEWLILNHDDYADISLSMQNLNMYQENQPPVCVLSRVSERIEPVPPEAQGINFDPNTYADGWRGTESCEFAVSGLTEAEYDSLSYDLLKAKSMQHLKNGGRILAIGHEETPQSLYHNPQLFPSLFPWLYPYGKGGFNSPLQRIRMSAQAQCRDRLLYGDRRFQEDEYFMYIAFNHEQIRMASVQNNLSVKRSNWSKIENDLLTADTTALEDMIQKAQKGPLTGKLSDSEKQWVRVLRHIEVVASAVHGSTASKRLMRNEIRSMLMDRGPPLWFITISPCDWKNPIVLYLSGEKIDVLSTGTCNFSYPDLQRRVARNPVACARFFDFAVRLFIDKILGFETDKKGLFGPVDSYYGTVEEQGRLSLHLHLLLWIQNTPSFQDIRDRLSERIQPFTEDLIAYLSDIQYGDYQDASESQVAGEHSAARVDSTYSDPTMQLPIHLNTSDEPMTLQNLKKQVNELIYLSNRHETHNSRCGGQTGSCKARFPRDIVPQPTVDEDGRLSLKKLEPYINTYNPGLTYFFRCNTDVTSLLTGTSIKAVLIYITDYVTKPSLKTYTIFDCILIVYMGSHDTLFDNNDPSACRRVILKMVNALTSRYQTGGPLIAAYMLGNGDHYTNREFQTFYWKPFSDYVAQRHSINDDKTDSNTSNVIDENSLLTNSFGTIKHVTLLDDWRYRPLLFQDLCLYEFVRTIRKRPAQSSKSSDASRRRFLSEHPQNASHIAYKVKNVDSWIINWVGPPLPRLGTGDDEFYYMTMVLLFTSWREGSELKLPHESWHDRFERQDFDDRSQQLMKNFKVLHECLDERDSYSAQNRKMKASFLPTGLFSEEAQTMLDNATYEDGAFKFADIDDEENVDLSLFCTEGRFFRQQCADADNAKHVLLSSGWKQMISVPPVEKEIPEFVSGLAHSATAWAAILQSLKTQRLTKMDLEHDEHNESSQDIPTRHRTLQDAIIVDEKSMPGRLSGQTTSTVLAD
ncbi:13678_t:CDS:1, partial [Acaulospora colombiana]